MGHCPLPCPLRGIHDLPDDFRVLRRLRLSDGPMVRLGLFTLCIALTSLKEPEL